MRVTEKRSSKRARTALRSNANMSGIACTASSRGGDNPPRLSFVDKLRDRAAAEGENRRAARHALDHHEPEGPRPVDRKQQGRRLPKKLGLFALIDLADEFHARSIQQRRDDLAEVGFIDLVDLRSDFQRQAPRARNGGGAVGPLLRRDPAEKGEIAATRFERRLLQVERAAGVEGAG